MERGEFVEIEKLDADTRALVDAARDVGLHAYARYSGFAVGAALRTASGEIHVGCNVENASYGATICAERAAVLSAVAHGQREFSEIVVWTGSDEPAIPCGMCCQVMGEFAPSLRIYLVGRGDVARRVRLDELFPETFRLDP